MRETDDKSQAAPDPLAELIRAAGRRPPPPREHYEQVFAAAHAAWRHQIEARKSRRWLAYAAALAAVVVTAAVLQAVLTVRPSPVTATVIVTDNAIEYRGADSQTWRETTGRGLQLNAGARVRTGPNGRVALQPANGGSLRLDTVTEIVLGEDVFELVSGKIYFDSDGRPTTLPVEIATSLGIVRDVGTQFEVKATPATLRVRVRSGRIALLDSPAADDIVGMAGTEVALSRQGVPTARMFAPDDPEWSWAETLAIAPSTQTQSILAYLTWIAHETGKELEFDSPNVELRAQVEDFVGDPGGLRPMDLLQLIEATSDFRFELTDEGTILIRRATNR